MKVTIITDSGEREVTIERMTRLENIIKGQGISCPFICDGTGACGKCKVQFLSEAPKPTNTEKRLLSKRLLNKGYRLACETIIVKDSRIFIPSEEKLHGIKHFDAEAIGEKRRDRVVNAGRKLFGIKEKDAEIGVAIDLGTTSIALELIDLSSGEVVYSTAFENHQSIYGADVVSRLESAIHGKQDVLSELVMKDIVNAIKEALSFVDKEIKPSKLPLFLAGNTAMIHMLANMPCEGLITFPYEPVELGMQSIVVSSDVDKISNDIRTSSINSKIDEEDNYTIKTIPSISTLVGADVVSAIYALDMLKEDEVNVLIDLGTNGEMVVSDRGRVKACSISMGPTFEGGNISCGMASVPGAISKVQIKNGFCKVETIDNKFAVGLCGSGVIETVYEFLKNDIIDQHGTFISQYDHGYSLCQLNKKESIIFTQDDVRQLQLAKAAMRASIDVLLNEADVSYAEVDNVYLAGGFGYNLDINKLIGIGALPVAWKKKIITVGNASLEGVRQYMVEKDDAKLNKIVEATEEVVVSNNETFKDLYLENVLFEAK